MLLPNSCYVCIPCFKSVAPRVCLAKEPLLAFFAPDMKKEMGVVIYMYLKYSQSDYIDSKYIWVHGSNSLGSSVITEIPGKGKDAARWDTGHVTPTVNSYIRVSYRIFSWGGGTVHAS